MLAAVCSITLLVRASVIGHFPFAFCPSPWRSFLHQCLRVKFDGLHAALECAADQRPGFTSGDQIKKPFFLFRRPAYPGIYASHFFAFSPSSTSRRMAVASGGLSGCFFAQDVIAS